MRAGDFMPPGTAVGELETDLLGALDRGEIGVHYQPQFSCRDDRLIGAEALSHWLHPVHGRIDGAQLFAIAARAGCALELSRAVKSAALAVAAGWDPRVGISLNLSAADLRAPDFASWILDACRRAGIARCRVMLEITEHALVHDLDASARQLDAVVEQDVCIALDDFGAGFCNFAYLKRLPLSALKLDRSMVDGIGHDLRDLAILRGILAMARALDLTVVAEGIERVTTREAVRREGCSTWQGFLGGRAMEEADFSAFAAGHAI